MAVGSCCSSENALQHHRWLALFFASCQILCALSDEDHSVAMKSSYIFMCAVRNQDMYRFLFMTLVQQGTFVFK
jgi:hypothetical protein